MSDVDTAPILVGVSDLFFATRISETAKQVGARVGFAGANTISGFSFTAP